MNPWDKPRFEYPATIPTMISDEERQYLYWLTSSYWKGRGHVVEMGSWLGGSTACLAAGLIANENRGNWQLHVYDSFVWREFMYNIAQLPIQVGESFEPFFAKNVAPYADVVRTHNAWLPDEEVAWDTRAVALRDEIDDSKQVVAWDSTDPVEILFIDGAKSWSGMLYLLGVFAPVLVPGALLVCQDFKCWGTFWVPATIELLAEHLELRHHLQHNTVSFEVVKPITQADLDALPRWEDLEAGDCANLIDAVAQKLERAGDTIGAEIVRIEKVRLLLQKGRQDAAVETFHRSERSWPLLSDDGNLTETRKWLVENVENDLAPRLRTRIRRFLWPAARRIQRRLGHRHS